jgi:hypothetical protein
MVMMMMMVMTIATRASSKQSCGGRSPRSANLCLPGRRFAPHSPVRRRRRAPKAGSNSFVGSLVQTGGGDTPWRPDRSSPSGPSSQRTRPCVASLPARPGEPSHRSIVVVVIVVVVVVVLLLLLLLRNRAKSLVPLGSQSPIYFLRSRRRPAVSRAP